LKKKLEFDFGYQFRTKNDHEEFLKESARDREFLSAKKVAKKRDASQDSL
jgi:hypothetical protein